MVRLTLRIGSDSGALQMKVESFAKRLAEKYGGCTVLKGTGHWVDKYDLIDSETSYTIVVVVSEDSVKDIKESVKRTFRALQDCNSVMLEREKVTVNFIQTT